MRVLHLSDVHVDVPLSEIPWREWLNKRFIGGANLVLRRGRHFAHAREKLALLADFAEREGVELVLCTGDYTALGTWPELRAARAAVERLTRAPLGYVTIPGNHDLYTTRCVEDGRFDAVFGDLMRTELPAHAVEGVYPYARLIGEEVAVVGVNSARPNPAPWLSSGRIPEAQLQALPRLLAAPALAGRFVFLLTHYAPRLANGEPDGRWHGLENADALLAACAGVQRGALLHGHVHRCYRVQVPGLRMELFGAGSTTQEHREGAWLFDLTPAGLTATRLSWTPEGWRRAPSSGEAPGAEAPPR